MAFYGKDGTAIIVSTRSKQWVANLKMPGDLRSLAFTPEGDLLAGCADGVVHKWDMRTRRAVWRFMDEGNLSVSSLACSPNGNFVATGCVSVCCCFVCLREKDWHCWRAPVLFAHAAVTIPSVTVCFLHACARMHALFSPYVCVRLKAWFAARCCHSSRASSTMSCLSQWVFDTHSPLFCLFPQFHSGYCECVLVA
jgi:hypothetical protein